MNSNISLSVLMSAYNAERYVRDAVSSILHQTYKDFEFIIINDGSTDHTGEILQEFAAQDNRIHLVKHEKNKGLIASLNHGINLSESTYIARMDADDIALPGRFEKQMAFLNLHPQINLLGGRYIRIDENNHEIGKSEPLFETDFLIRWRMLFANCFIHSTIIFKRELARQLGGYDPAKLHTEDYDLWVRMMKKGAAANLPDYLVKLRCHDESISIIHEGLQTKTTHAIAWENFQSTFPEFDISLEDFPKFRSFFISGFGEIESEHDQNLAAMWLKSCQTYANKYQHNANEKKIMNQWLKKRLIQTRKTLLRVPKIIYMFPVSSIWFMIKATGKSFLNRFANN